MSQSISYTHLPAWKRSNRFYHACASKLSLSDVDLERLKDAIKAYDKVTSFKHLTPERLAYWGKCTQSPDMQKLRGFIDKWSPTTQEDLFGGLI